MQNSIHSETRTICGRSVTISFNYNPFMGEPWKEDDGHGVVSDWTSRDKRAGELVLCGDRYSKRFYDYAETLKLARRDGWGLGDEEKAKLTAKLGRTPTAREIVAASVMADFENLRAWCNNEWHWVFYTIESEDESYSESLGGIDSTSMDHFTEEAFENAEYFFTREDAAAMDAACRDIATV